MFRTALRNVLAHKARLLMTVLAVMLGVAFVAGTLVFTDTLGNAFRKQSAKGYEKIAVEITAQTGRGDTEGLPDSVVKRIEALDQVDRAVGRVDGFAGVADRKGKLIGNGWANSGGNFAPGKDGKDPSYEFTQGEGPTSPGQIALDKDTADKGKYKVGDTVRVATSGPVKEYTLAGVFTTDLGAVNAGGSLVLFETSVAQRQYLSPGQFSTVTVTPQGNASDDAVLAAVKPLLPKDTDAETGTKLADDEADMIKREMSGMSSMLLSFAGIALFVGIFLIANTFTMLVAQRTRELALMRAVGASRRQVKRSVILEAGLVGVLASAVGFGLGLGIAVGLRSLVGSFGAKIPNGPLIISPTAVLSALIVGVVVTVLAAWLPARRAAKIPPVAAMSSVHSVASAKSLLIRNIIGSVLTAAGLAAIVVGAGNNDGTDGRIMIAGGAFLALIGVIVLIPQLSRPMIALVRPLLVRAFGVSGKLASQNAVRNPRRTGATASALAIGLTLVTGLTVIGVTVGQAVDKATTDNIRADYLVTMSSGTSLDTSAVTALAGAKGVESYSRGQRAHFEIKGSNENVTGVDGKGFEGVFNVDTISGSLKTLPEGQLVIQESVAEDKGWKAGDKLPVVFERNGKETPKTLTVGAIVEDNEMFSSYVVDQKVLAPFEEKPDITEVWVKMAGGQTETNEQALVDSLGNNPAMTVMDKQDIRNFFGGMINTMLNVMYGLLAMALIIAVLGVVNTLAMSVFERQQEIGMLRAIGLDKRRVKRMIRLEAVVISVFGAVIGVGLGSFLGWAIGETFRDSIPGYALVIPWGRIGIFLLLAGVVGVLASLWPARSAAKLNMLTAIKTE
ncbi:FtsX-like permease family protein [Streptomyces sp. NPDC020875]|uniref:ABC transporter permease n=1 Tax=Streptomyces sp. NPDC020875 TaxID=3154898 RepID=UPI0033CB547D